MFDLCSEIPVGIDLGTTNSCIGYWDGNEVRIVPNRIGEKTTPSVIYSSKDEFIIGEHIQKDIKLVNECEKIYSIKRIIGQDYNDKDLIKEINSLHYKIIKNEKTNKPLIELKKNEIKTFTPEELSSLILKKLISDLKKEINEIPNKVVISVPAYFDDAQRNATIETAKLAGLSVIRLINEPTAAALSYGLGQNFCPIKKNLSSFSNIFKRNRNLRVSQSLELNSKNDNIDFNEINIKDSVNIINNKGKNIMVFDLGGGTFDLAILKLNIEDKEYEVKSKYSDKHLGGDDFDNKIVEYCLTVCNFPKDQIDNKSKERLKKACEYAKRELSKPKEIDEEDVNNRDISSYIKIDNFINGEDLFVKITKEKFENEICKDLFDKLFGHFDEVLIGAGLQKGEIEEIILVGGSTRMPKIKEKIREAGFDCKINDEINPDEVVAYGATILAAMLLGPRKNKVLEKVRLFDITPISLGTDVINNSTDPKILALGNKMSRIIPKWTSIPIIKKKSYKTAFDYQDSMQISIYEGENDYLKDNKLLGKFYLQGIPKKPKGEVECEVEFNIDENNILRVKAYEKTNDVSNFTEIKVVSDQENRQFNNILGLNIHEFKEIKKNYKKNVLNLIKVYNNAKDNKIKINALEKYNTYIENSIKETHFEENQVNNNNNIEKYFFYTYQLLESFEEILYLSKDENKKDDILKEIKKKIDIFKNQSIYYIKEIIELFKISEREIFLKILLYSFEAFNEYGLDYLNNLKKNCRYYAKLYFEEVIKLYNKYIKDDDALYDIKSDIGNQKNISEQKLKQINSNALLLINLSKQKRKLIDSSNQIKNSNNILEIINNWDHTGFTYYDKNLNPENNDLTNDDYNLILDQLERILEEITIQLQENKENENMINELNEEKGICYGNIVKIKFIYQKGNEYAKYLIILKKCLDSAELCHKNTNECEWYQEALNIKKVLDETMCKIEDEEDESIKEEVKAKLKDIEDNYNTTIERFIGHILTDFPYKGFNLNNLENFDFDNINKNVIEFLRRNYNPDDYERNTREEKIKYRIIVNISQKLNNILDNYNNNN